MLMRIVVAGAGYAGLPAAQRLARRVCSAGVKVTVVNDSPWFVERPRLHQVATGQPVPVLPLPDLLGGTGAQLLVDRVMALDLDRREVLVEQAGRIRYDVLIYALGSTIDVDSVPGVRRYAYSLAGPQQAARFRDRVTGLAAQGGRMVVCGGGLTGIEAAAELAETHPSLRMELVSRDRPGWWLSERARAYLAESLDRLAVTVRPGRSIVEVRPGELVAADGGRIPFDACLWAGGFRVPGIAAANALPVTGCGRIVVDDTLRVVSHPDVYAVGDAAAAAGPWGEAMAYGCRTGGFMAPYVADAVATALDGGRHRPFRFRYLHQCLSLGRRDGLVQFVDPVEERPLRAMLTGRLAARYKEATLRGAVWMFRHPGPYLPRRAPRPAPPTVVAGGAER
ncbi:MAG: NAD(P)/FAD-dependent oxidoreductase [Pseudonocardiaceae bacterium]